MSQSSNFSLPPPPTNGFTPAIYNGTPITEAVPAAIIKKVTEKEVG